jgi:hypothetical protein
MGTFTSPRTGVACVADGVAGVEALDQVEMRLGDAHDIPEVHHFRRPCELDAAALAARAADETVLGQVVHVP